MCVIEVRLAVFNPYAAAGTHPRAHAAADALVCGVDQAAELFAGQFLFVGQELFVRLTIGVCDGLDVVLSCTDVCFDSCELLIDVLFKLDFFVHVEGWQVIVGHQQAIDIRWLLAGCTADVGNQVYGVGIAAPVGGDDVQVGSVQRDFAQKALHQFRRAVAVYRVHNAYSLVGKTVQATAAHDLRYAHGVGVKLPCSI